MKSSMKLLVAVVIGFGPFIDLLNKVVNLPLSIGQVIRVIFMACCLFFILNTYKLKSKVVLYITLVSLYLVSNALFMYYTHLSLGGLMVDLIYFSKILFSIFTIFTLIGLYKERMIDMEYFDKLIYTNIFLIVILFTTSLSFGLAQGSYGTVGKKGLFMSLNALNIALLVGFVFILNKVVYKKSNKLMNIFMMNLILILLVLMGTKSSFIFTALILFLYLLQNITRVKHLLKYTVTSITFLVISFLIIQNYFMDVIKPIIDRQMYFLQTSSYNFNYLTYITSGRNHLLEIGSNIYLDRLSLTSSLFGLGLFNFLSGIAGSLLSGGYFVGNVRGIEMDLFEIFFSTGLIGLFLIYGLFALITFKVIKNIKDKDFTTTPYFFSFMIMIIFSFMGGHLFEPLASTLLSVVCARIYLLDIKNKGLDYNLHLKKV